MWCPGLYEHVQGFSYGTTTNEKRGMPQNDILAWNCLEYYLDSLFDTVGIKIYKIQKCSHPWKCGVLTYVKRFQITKEEHGMLQKVIIIKARLATWCIR